MSAIIGGFTLHYFLCLFQCLGRIKPKIIHPLSPCTASWRASTGNDRWCPSARKVTLWQETGGDSERKRHSYPNYWQRQTYSRLRTSVYADVKHSFSDCNKELTRWIESSLPVGLCGWLTPRASCLGTQWSNPLMLAPHSGEGYFHGLVLWEAHGGMSYNFHDSFVHRATYPLERECNQREFQRCLHYFLQHKGKEQAAGTGTGGFRERPQTQTMADM